MMIGNKNDLEDLRAVDSSEGVVFARTINANFFETSALSSDNVENAMNDLIEEIHRQNKSGLSMQNEDTVQLKEGREIKSKSGCCSKE